jgi:glycosyltransferase involved in cell wall biosynthesis
MNRQNTPRIAVLYPVPFGHGGIFGGGERYAYELARALSKRTPTRLVTFGENPVRRRDGSLDVEIRKPITYVRGQRFNPLSLDFVSSLWDVDVIHCVSWYTLITDMAILFARATGKRIVVTDVGGGSNFSFANRLALGNLVDAFFLIAEQGGKAFAQFRNKWHIISAGIDVEHFQPGRGPRKGILSVGRLLPHKGANYVVEAVRPETPLTVVGRPGDDRYFKLLTELSRGKDVTFVTDASDADVLRYYQAAQVMVFGSVNRTVYGDYSDLPELLGFTAMEAMACGLPVIASNVGGMSEVVVDGLTGYLVPPGDVSAIRERLDTLLGNPDLAARLGAAARQRILDKFTWDVVADDCLRGYRQLSRTRRRRVLPFWGKQGDEETAL